MFPYALTTVLEEGATLVEAAAVKVAVVKKPVVEMPVVEAAVVDKPTTLVDETVVKPAPSSTTLVGTSLLLQSRTEERG